MYGRELYESKLFFLNSANQREVLFMGVDQNHRVLGNTRHGRSYRKQHIDEITINVLLRKLSRFFKALKAQYL